MRRVSSWKFDRISYRAEGIPTSTKSSKADVIRSTFLKSWSPEADVIRGSEDHQKLKTGSFNVCQMLLLSRLSLQKYRSLEQRLNQGF